MPTSIAERLPSIARMWNSCMFEQHQLRQTVMMMQTLCWLMKWLTSKLMIREVLDCRVEDSMQLNAFDCIGEWTRMTSHRFSSSSSIKEAQEFLNKHLENTSCRSLPEKKRKSLRFLLKFRHVFLLSPHTSLLLLLTMESSARERRQINWQKAESNWVAMWRRRISGLRK